MKHFFNNTKILFACYQCFNTYAAGTKAEVPNCFKSLGFFTDSTFTWGAKVSLKNGLGKAIKIIMFMKSRPMGSFFFNVPCTKLKFIGCAYAV